MLHVAFADDDLQPLFVAVLVINCFLFLQFCVFLFRHRHVVGQDVAFGQHAALRLSFPISPGLFPQRYVKWVFLFVVVDSCCV